MDLTYYTVYREKDDEIIAWGTANECAIKMGIKVSSFYYAVSRQRSGRCTHPKYRINVERRTGIEKKTGSIST